MTRLYYGSKNIVLNSINEEFKTLEVVQIDNIEQQIKNINKFFDDNKIFLYICPSNEELKSLEYQIAKNIGFNFLYFENDSFDGRISLIQSIKKNNHIYDCSLPIVGDRLSFKRQVLNFTKKLRISLKDDCYEWLENNCPIYRSKSKSNKKETLYYDLDILFKEIEKISTVTNIVEIDDFNYSFFKKDDDIFQLIDYILNKDLKNSIQLYEKLKYSIGEQAVLMIIIYQLIFMLNLIGGKEKYKFNYDKILEYVELRDILGKYLDQNWEESKFSIKSQNPMRIKIALSKYNISSKDICFILCNIVDAILDLRNNTENNVSSFLTLYRITNV